jgi:WhiB family redox-sensing transcriptional regulator
LINAKCLGRTELFFAPDESESRAERRFRESQAKAVCHECVVRVECLSEALKSDERFGIWGGLTERERRAVRRSDQHDEDIAGPGRLTRLPAVVVRGRAMSSVDTKEFGRS